MHVVPFQPAHLAGLRLQRAQAHLASLLGDPVYGAALAKAGPAFTGLSDGEVVGCAGLSLLSPGRAYAWALLSDCRPVPFRAVHRAVKTVLDRSAIRRIETAVDSGFAAGERWAAMLGFAREGRMRAYLPNGDDAELYARVQPMDRET